MMLAVIFGNVAKVYLTLIAMYLSKQEIYTNRFPYRILNVLAKLVKPLKVLLHYYWIKYIFETSKKGFNAPFTNQ